MLNLVTGVVSCILILSSQSEAQWAQSGGHVSYPKFIAVPSDIGDHKEERIGYGDNVFHSNYKASDYGYPISPKPDNIFARRSDHDDHHHNKYSEKVLRKAYNDFINNKLALKKRIFTSLLQKTIDKTVDITASLTKNAVDFISKISIDTAANVAKKGAKAVIHKKEEKFKDHHHY